MEKKLAFAMYKPKKGKEQELEEILSLHIPLLRQYGLISEKETHTVRSKDGTIIEIFEWINEESKEVAHQHPAMRSLWGKMMAICTFPTLSDLPESKRSFPNFSVIAKKQ